MRITATLGSQRATTTLRCQLARTARRSTASRIRDQFAASSFTIARAITDTPRRGYGKRPQQLCTRWRLNSSTVTSEIEVNEEAEAPAEFCVFMEVSKYSSPQFYRRLMFQHPSGGPACHYYWARFAMQPSIDCTAAGPRQRARSILCGEQCCIQQLSSGRYPRLSAILLVENMNSTPRTQAGTFTSRE